MREKYEECGCYGVSEISGERKTSDRRSFLRTASLMSAAVGATSLLGLDNLMSLAATNPKSAGPKATKPAWQKATSIFDRRADR
jgi:hypothetical protein